MHQSSYKKCDPETLKKIVSEVHSKMSKPHLVPDVSDFSIVDDETGERSESYSLNMGNPLVRECVIRIKTIKEHVPDHNFEDAFSYSWRIQMLNIFINNNEDQLKTLDLIRITEGQNELVSNHLVEAASTCRVGDKGFKFLDMMKEIKKYSQNR